jgi:hypothetical protein
MVTHIPPSTPPTAATSATVTATPAITAILAGGQTGHALALDTTPLNDPAIAPPTRSEPPRTLTDARRPAEPPIRQAKSQAKRVLMFNGSPTSSAGERTAWLTIKHCCPRPTLTEAAGLATDAELCAQLGHGKAPDAGEDNESMDLFPVAYVGPGHRPMCHQSPRIKVSPISPGRTPAFRRPRFRTKAGSKKSTCAVHPNSPSARF